MTKKTAGIHHITAIVGDAQENIDFYAGILGLRLVKKTINFDDPNTYHFYFGNDSGEPGSIITFFPWENARQGRIGDGQVGVTTYVIPEGAMNFWKKRLHTYGISTTKTTRFNETFLQFRDVHGLQLELVERKQGPKNSWEFNGVTSDVAIKGLGGAILYSILPGKTAETLGYMIGLEKIADDGNFIRFQSSSELGNIIDVKWKTGKPGIEGVGTVHHIAWRAKDNADQIDWQHHIGNNNFYVTPVHNRSYFNAIYFRESGRILFEFATDQPGFTHDESIARLGEKLILPAQFEQYRTQLEQHLPKVSVRNIQAKGENNI